MTESKCIYWSNFTVGEWHFYLAATAKGLCYVGSPDSKWEELQSWIMKKFSNVNLIEDNQKLAPYKKELTAYFQGELAAFSFATDLQGTVFQQKVWHALHHVPYGKTYNYAQIAELIGKPTAVRAVGTAIGANPVLVSVPCHRVIGKDGTLTGYRGGLEMKTHLLKLEQRTFKQDLS
ncbi:methylated-DNA--[protein]-cysteine S-methyltransferase [Paraliobacillus sediminis]|uniref:methylated-DNA--[protein]-cysteine S-methyltransferase n=1 Tax=Paraliobacillus sediminis TaxID=1885916 RepID=UPI000E3CB2A0|nr:methylated-DNA--[protein]-cysteine S-methyltransferase [Paraliobacillus sediminis]